MNLNKKDIREHEVRFNSETGRWIFPFNKMGVGDYFIMKGITRERANTIGACGWCHCQNASKMGYQFRRKKLGEGIYKFWRAS